MRERGAEETLDHGLTGPVKASTCTVSVLSGGCGGLLALGAQHKPLKQAPSRIKTATHQPGGACCSLRSLLALRVPGRAEVKVQTNNFTSAPLAKERKGSAGLRPQALRRPSHPRLGLRPKSQRSRGRARDRAQGTTLLHVGALPKRLSKKCWNNEKHYLALGLTEHSPAEPSLPRPAKLGAKF